MRCATNDAGFGRLLTLGEDRKSLGAFSDDIRITNPRGEGIGCGRPACHIALPIEAGRCSDLATATDAITKRRQRPAEGQESPAR
jgi:hypothetical protein